MTPRTFDIDYNEHRLCTIDEYELNVWVMKPEKSVNNNITIVIVGSDAGNMGFSLPYAFHLLNSGYKVVTFDYRGFGESSEFEYNPSNIYHSEYIADFNAVINWCKNELDYRMLGTMGFSMGTLISSVGYSVNAFDFYIGEGFITSPQANKMRVEEIKNIEINLPETYVDDESAIDKLNIPGLLFASRLDKITTLQDCYEFCSKHDLAETIVYDGEHLRGAATLGFQNYITVINDFIKNANNNGR